MSYISDIYEYRFAGAIALFMGKIMKNGLGVLERGYDLLQNGILKTLVKNW